MAYKRISPIPVIEGGTNATSMATTDGVVYYDGTRLVTTAVGTATNVLTSNGVGVAPTFQAIPAAGVTSITGTANQITASASTGAVTLSTPSTFIAPGSIASTTSITAANQFSVTTGTVSINSGTSTLGISTDANATTLSIGTGAAVKGLTLGSTNSTSATTLQAGTGGLTIDGAATTAITIGTSLTTGTILIGGTAQTGLISLGATAAGTVRIGYGTGATTTNIGNNGTAGTVSIATSGSNVVSIGTGATGAVNIGNTTGGTNVTGPLTITTGSLFIPATTSSTLGVINFGGGSFIHAYGASSDNNTFVGNGAGNFTLTSGTAIDNTGIGASALLALTTGNFNTAVGEGAGTKITTGSSNSMVGVVTGQFTTGSFNTLMGYGAGFSYATSESSNICLGYGVFGTVGESNVLRIGNANGTGNGNLAKTFIQGISGVTVTGTAVLCSTAGQLGTIASSRRFKSNIQDMDDSNVIHKLRPVTFTMNNDETKHRQWGLIAEEVQEIYPDLVNNDEHGEPHSVRYLDLIPMLLKEVQDLRIELNQLKGL